MPESFHDDQQRQLAHGGSVGRGRLDAELAEMAKLGMSMRRMCLALYDRYGIEVTAPTVKVWLAEAEGEAA